METLTVAEAKTLMAEGQFEEGTMLPKIRGSHCFIWRRFQQESSDHFHGSRQGCHQGKGRHRDHRLILYRKQLKATQKEISATDTSFFTCHDSNISGFLYL